MLPGALRHRHRRAPPPLACRVRLATTCRALRAASVGWFRGDVFQLDTEAATPPQHLSWLCRVKGKGKPAVRCYAAQQL